eukprot:gnl/MRDRNA2_/MRDRNA2_102404_c0_seq1.p1 gnl/MRDRNA2_/MRDRNA2_102404_c0~~gnl/MRDRNA2_/MRDRNA2_102404_c0_seq1.p1  ORF type:complete len:635 (-),score=121.99 gnl/MRDRNA2_/MRDRNA2_102404_c0_seq1:11-1669(-)
MEAGDNPWDTLNDALLENGAQDESALEEGEHSWGELNGTAFLDESMLHEEDYPWDELNATALLEEADAAYMNMGMDMQLQKWPTHWTTKLVGKKKVGEGSFGKVFVASVKCDQTVRVAVKELAITQRGRIMPHIVKEVEGEIMMMKLFTTGDFISYFEHKKTNNQFLIMMEAANGGDLSDVIPRWKGISEKVKVQLWVESLRGVKHMHDHDYIHRDLKPANILVSAKCTRGPCHAKVADLGCSCSHLKKPHCTGTMGTPLYIAPETWKYENGKIRKYGTAVQPKNDVWAMGLILYELLYSALPSAIGNSPSMAKLATNIMRFNVKTDSRYSRMKPQLQALMTAMLNLDPSYRSSAAEILPLAEAYAASLGCDLNVGGQVTLPDCWRGGPKPVRPVEPSKPKPKPQPVKPDDGEPRPPVDPDDESEGDIIIVTIDSPRTNIEANILGASLQRGTTGKFNEEGLIKVPYNSLKYAAKGICDNDIVLSINGVQYSQILDQPSLWDLMRDGGMAVRGRSQAAPVMSIKLLRRRLNGQTQCWMSQKKGKKNNGRGRS